MAQQWIGTTTLLQDAGSTAMNFLQDPMSLPTQTSNIALGQCLSPLCLVFNLKKKQLQNPQKQDLQELREVKAESGTLCSSTLT